MSETPSSGQLLMEVQTVLGFRVRVTRDYWQLIVTIKHPIMVGQENVLKDVLQNPDEIRRSKSDLDVYLFYKQSGTGRWVCAVTKRLNGDGFLITTYLTDAIKEGDSIWHK